MVYTSVVMKKNVHDALYNDFTDPIRDALWGHIYLTPALAALTGSAAFTRLYRIFQLGPVYRVYPGATHTRASHSIGVFHLGRRLLTNLVEKGAGEWLSGEGVLSFLCACLLHDLGHFPYTHSLKELSLTSHESLTAEIILSEPLKSLIAKAGADPEFTAAIVDTRGTGGARDSGGKTIEKELLFYRKLLSGALDPDKLDYLNRDARYCGVPYGAQDVDFILSRLYPHPDRGVDIDSRGIPSVESILFSKYLMYRTVYWHRQVRSATAMIKKALLQGLKNRVIAPEELYNLDDQSLFTLIQNRRNDLPLFTLAESVQKGRLYSTVAEFPYTEADHGGLQDIQNRVLYETNLAGELQRAGISIRPEEVIIDIPEPVSFETGLFVSDEDACFANSSSAFTVDTVRSFVDTLYTVRIFVDPSREQAVKDLPKFRELPHIKKGWLFL
jgi:HD superfamily phosphohydrolase